MKIEPGPDLPTHKQPVPDPLDFTFFREFVKVEEEEVILLGAKYTPSDLVRPPRTGEADV